MGNPRAYIYAVLVTALSLLCAYPLLAQSAADKPTPNKKPIVIQKKDWLVRCRDKSDSNSCEALILAEIFINSERKPGFTLVISNSDRGGKMLTVSVPHDNHVYLPNGLRFYVDRKLKVAYPFVHCTKNACFVQKKLENKLIRSFKRGNRAVLRVTLISGKNLDIEFSLIGFTASMNIVNGIKPVDELGGKDE